MNSFWKTKHHKSDVLPEKRRLNFRSTSELIARRKRLRQQVGVGLALVIGIGLLLVE